MEDSKEVNYLFSAAPSVKVVIIAGSHDHIGDNSTLLSSTWGPSVMFLTGENLTSVYFENINTEVYGLSCYRAEIKEPLLDGIQVPLNSRTQVLMAHSGGPAHLPISFNSLELSLFSYMALGHIHRPHIMVEEKMTYYGSSEPLGLTETGPHSYYMGEIRPIIKKLLSLKFIPASSLQYVPLAINASKSTTSGELPGRIAREIQNHGGQNICRFRLGGMRDPETEFDLEQLSSCFGIVETISDSEPQYDFLTLFVEHPSDIVGFYIQALQKDDMSPVEKKTLYYRVGTLFCTTDERN